MRRRSKLFLAIAAAAGLAAIVAVAAAAAWLAGPWLARREAIAAMRDACPSCELDLDGVSVNFWRLGEASAQNVRFKAWVSARTLADIKAEAVRIHARPGAMLGGRIEIDDILISRPEVVLLEQARAHPESVAKKSETDDSSASDWPVAIVGALRIEGGAFAYRQSESGTEFRVRDIDGELFHVAPGESPAKARLNGRLGSTGRMELAIAYPLKSKPPYLDVDLAVEKLKIEDVSSILRAESGVRLGGEIARAHGVATMRGRGLETKMTGAYDGLKIEIEKTAERGAVKAFLRNLGAAAFVDKESQPAEKGAPKGKVTEVKLERRAEESVVGFILRGFQNAAMKMAGAL